jgi:hypothetical protein
MNKGMRRSPVALLALTAGLTAAAVVRRFAGRRRSTGPVASSATATATATTPTRTGSVPSPDPAAEAVVLPFTRHRSTGVPTERPAERPAAAPVRCGHSGGVTKAGAPCAARATSAGRCHHHRVAA